VAEHCDARMPRRKGAAWDRRQEETGLARLNRASHTTIVTRLFLLGQPHTAVRLPLTIDNPLPDCVCRASGQTGSCFQNTMRSISWK